MGMGHQTIVDREASLAEAQQLASSVLEYLIDKGIVEADMKNCGVHGNRMGYPPGRNYVQAVNDPDNRIHGLKLNGLEIIIKRSVFDCGQGGFELFCPHCRAENTAYEEWADAVGIWYDNIGEGLLECLHCSLATSVTDWHYEPTIAFGNLGFTFWNWSPLKESFISTISLQLGHKTSYVTGGV